MMIIACSPSPDFSCMDSKLLRNGNWFLDHRPSVILFCWLWLASPGCGVASHGILRHTKPSSFMHFGHLEQTDFWSKTHPIQLGWTKVYLIFFGIPSGSMDYLLQALFGGGTLQAQNFGIWETSTVKLAHRLSLWVIFKAQQRLGNWLFALIRLTSRHDLHSGI